MSSPGTGRSFRRTRGLTMLWLLMLALVAVSIAAFVRSEIRSACCGIALSNGLEVLVDREAHEEILRRLEATDPTAVWKRWDHVILNTIRDEHPEEWRFLARSLLRETRSHERTRDSARARRWAAFR